jgi:hypothetical protein
MIAEQQAWLIEQWLLHRTQVEIGDELGVSNATICSAIKDFCDRWSGHNVERERAYGDERIRIAEIALANFRKQTGTKPERPAFNAHDLKYDIARLEHAWLLRAEGLPLKQIAYRVGVNSNERARQMISKFGRRVQRALRFTYRTPFPARAAS